jgi:CxxC motif-containing protein (DUF1111 family)
LLNRRFNRAKGYEAEKAHPERRSTWEEIMRRSAVFPLSKSFLFYVFCAASALAQARDPGVRGGPPGAGGPLVGLDAAEDAFWFAALDRFQQIQSVSGSIEPRAGLGPRFNSNSCASCHAQPAVGGSSPATNPQVAVATLDGATNSVPSFITANGPVREARFKSDGGVHDLFTIQGRRDAPGCVAAQPDFSDLSNISFRIPTPLFGVGLVENTLDETLEADAAAQATLRQQLHIAGHFNHRKGGLDSEFNTSGNTGTIARFGWKGQNPSLGVFAGEAYVVEQGVTNELFTVERDVADTSGCIFNALPEDSTNLTNTIHSVSPAADFSSDVVNFAAFMRLNEPPMPAPDTSSIARGRRLFSRVGCAACHITQHTTAQSVFTGQSGRTYFPYSDFQLHEMGRDLDDGIAQGDASSSEFRTAPLWGLGQRIFFLHDGRTTDLVAAIQAHDSPQSEARDVIRGFNSLSVSRQQDILNFLRAL